MDFILDEPTVLARTVVVGVAAYLGLVALLRISGKRTLTQLNAFDFVVTVALGSTLATILLSADTSLAQGLLAVALLITLQFSITWTSQRSRLVARLAKSEPTVLVHHGEVIEDALWRERVLAAELRAALREHGIARIEDADLVVLETDGSIAVVKDVDQPAGSLALPGRDEPGTPTASGTDERTAP